MLKSIFKFSISTWINFILGFLSTFVLTRIFFPDVLGVINLFYSSINSLLSMICCGMDSAYIRFYNEPPKNNSKEDLLFKLISICVVIASFLGFIMLSFFPSQISMMLFDEDSKLLCICLIIGTIDQIILRFLNYSYRMSVNITSYNIQSILINIVTRLSVILGVLINRTAEMAIILNVVCMSILTFCCLVAQRKQFIPKQVNLSYSGYKEVFKFALYGAPANIILHFYTLSSQLILKIFLGTYAVGIYSSAAFFSSILTVVKGGFATYWSAFIYANYKKEKNKICEMHDAILYLAIVFLAVIVLTRDISYIFIGTEYHESKMFFSLVLMYPLLQTIMETTGYGIPLAKKTYLTTLISVISMLVNVGVGLLLIPRMGIIGVACGNFSSAVITYGLTTLIAQRYYRTILNKGRSFLGLLLLLSIATMSCIIKNKYLILYIFVILVISSFVYIDTLRKLKSVLIKVHF